jgi:hypothetical protein
LKFSKKGWKILKNVKKDEVFSFPTSLPEQSKTGRSIGKLNKEPV